MESKFLISTNYLVKHLFNKWCKYTFTGKQKEQLDWRLEVTGKWWKGGWTKRGLTILLHKLKEEK